MNLYGTDRSTGEKISYDDSPVRTAFIKIGKEVFGWDLSSNKNRYGIDLLSHDGSFGVELERGGFTDYWSQNQYDFNKNTLPFSTVNIPSRKEKYWRKEFEITTATGRKYTNFEPNFERNVFIRSNKDFTQFILISSEVIRNDEKLVRGEWKTDWITTGGVEKWLCFRREHVDTYNLVEGVFVLDKDFK